MSEKNIKRYVLSSAIGAGIGMISASALIFMLAGVFGAVNIPSAVIPPMISAVLIFGGFCGGFSGARISGEKGILCGMLSGVIIFTAVWIIGGILSIGGFGIAAITKALMIALSGSIGGIIGVNYNKRR